MNEKKLGFEQKQTHEVEGAKEIIESLDSIIKPIEEVKKMIMRMQEMQAGTNDKLRGQFSEQNIEWLVGFAKKIQEASAENAKLLKFFVESHFDAMKKDYNEK